MEGNGEFYLLFFYIQFIKVPIRNICDFIIRCLLFFLTMSGGL